MLFVVRGAFYLFSLRRDLCRFAEGLHVKKVLFPAGGELVADQIVSRYDTGGRVAIDRALDAIGPRFVEGNAINALQDIDSIGWLAYLKS